MGNLCRQLQDEQPTGGKKKSKSLFPLLGGLICKTTELGILKGSLKTPTCFVGFIKPQLLSV